MDTLNDIFATLSSFLWGWPMIILLLGTHLFLTIRLHFPQRKIFKAIKLSVKKDKNATGDVSQFGALATALAATIGTGNIIGVATAIALGGPGAVLWCWLTGVFGISTKYAEGLLAVKYRVKTQRGQMLGGPMYALEKGLGWKWLAILFALFAAIASFGIGSTVQANAISTLVENQYGISPYITGTVVCALGAAVIIGGVKSISRVCGMLVPFMALFYVLGCIYILFVNHAYLWPAIKVISESAFTTRAAGGGFAGSTLMMAARYGIARGLFSNESGLGSAPIAAAAAQTKEPVRQGLVSMTGTFIDTIIICTMTGLSIVLTGAWKVEGLQGVQVTTYAFNEGLPIPATISSFLLMLCLVFFAFTTILGWDYYSERCLEYLSGGKKKSIMIYRWLYILAVFIGPYMTVSAVWTIADIFNGLMAIPNMIAIFALSGVVVRETRDFFSRHNKQPFE